MSFGGGSSGSKPKLKQIDIQAAENLALPTDIASYAASDADWAARFPSLPGARDFMINDALLQSRGGISTQATGALNEAGLSDVAEKIPGKNEFETARNLGRPLLEKEARDRNFAANLLAINPQRTFGLGGSDVMRIALANTGNINALNLAASGTAANAYNANVLQTSQNIGALSTIFGGLAKNYATTGNVFSPYTNPYGSFYYPNVVAQSQYGQAMAPNPEGIGYDLPGG